MKIITSNYAKRCTLRLLGLVLTLITAAENLYAQPSVTLRPVITENLTAPMQFVHAGDATGRMFVAERAGVIKVFDNSDTKEGLYPYRGIFMDISSMIYSQGEGGLLSIVFHPEFEQNTTHRGELFVYFTDNANAPNSDLVLRRYKVADPLSYTASVTASDEILRIPHPTYSNHNGGEMHFGPNDGLLYLSVGDGGGAGGPGNNSQRTTPASPTDKSYLLGKILRLDVNNISQGLAYAIPAGNPFSNEVYDYGLRNPFRWSFDRTTGDMWIGDVGQSMREEIDFRPAATAPGVNYGWNCFEGDLPYTPAAGNCGGFPNFAPAFAYQGVSVIGGVFYRGTDGVLANYFISADYGSGNIHFTKRNAANDGWETVVKANTIAGIADFDISDIGESESGEVHLVGLASNAIYRLESVVLPVKLTSFKAVKTAEGARLNWQTSSEENFSNFEVQYSADQGKFQTVGTVASSNQINGTTYQFSHSMPALGNAYYRLKMMDLDKTFEYSRIVSLQTDELAEGGFVRPSLVNSGSMNLLLEGSHQSFELVSTNGAVFHKEDISGKKGPLNIPVNKITSGMYIVRLIGNENVQQQKILILN
ncbi:PQQ-dependent sugar dehydrogenase [Dyadobacter psychrotolerans]|uniref:Glucose dehydrogenase n=1 Tax=Dyadobacter psychrotolerans TaxID=2541721 RepID=A0A4R5DS08_9BACT|nr:PQQ-dependent sugar dehydrogenase [Dyadobacter psychrotolerans]TDE13613.1 glucose dehydrogenase [Dyadobacter psychrotolerans]